MTRYEIQKKLHVSQIQRNMVETAVMDCVMMAKKRFPSSNIPFPEIRYDLVGQAAGQAIYDRVSNPTHVIRINPNLLNENEKRVIEQIVPHEMAHVVVSQVWEEERKVSVKGHGYEWQSVMRTFGLVPERCHNMDVSSVKALRGGVEYHFNCGCVGKVFKLSKNRCTRWANGTDYRCPICKCQIQFDKRVNL